MVMGPLIDQNRPVSNDESETPVNVNDTVIFAVLAVEVQADQVGVHGDYRKPEVD